MSEWIVRHVKLAGKASFFILSKVILYTLVGFVINSIAFVSFWFMLLPDTGNAAHGAASFSLFTPFLSWQGVFVFILFFVTLPIIYFITGKKQGISKALNYIINEDKIFIFNYMLSQFSEKVKKNSENIGSASPSAKTAYENYLTHLDNMPKPMGWLVRVILAKAGINKVSEILEGETLEQLSTDKGLESMGEKMSQHVQLDLFEPGFKAPVILFSTNILLIIVTANLIP